MQCSNFLTKITNAEIVSPVFDIIKMIEDICNLIKVLLNNLSVSFQNPKSLMRFLEFQPPYGYNVGLPVPRVGSSGAENSIQLKSLSGGFVCLFLQAIIHVGRLEVS